MECTQIQEWIAEYFDLPEEEQRRQAVDRHIEHCDSCREEWTIWQESLLFLESEGQMIPEEAVPLPDRLQEQPAPSVASRVMGQIYEQESWRIPVAERIYSLPYKLRRNMLIMVAFCLALFLFSFVYAIGGPGSKNELLAQDGDKFGLHPTASASGPTSYEPMVAKQMAGSSFAATSLIEPLKLGPIQTNPNYWIVVSLLGLIGTLLIMNWLSRIRS
ncbi:hypothetical protein J31TS4_07340 [Paenibacillus sp. J31TS4]|uniref:anti-sigma factor family protein n=1 Tax=Paenibacillus sp. J31TS4 TaxID=2807195 RepID=UPI001B1F8E68|nr:zf-HC2 domain-containing protein [Paenibacillus sp. J31TS4]GIP37454.1 hypothetical protein J31TS4_07340 [Paenibacillus sp. J31TS4]